MSDFMESRTPNRPRVTLDQLGFLVTVPGRPLEVLSFTVDQEVEAQAYAAERGGEVKILPR